MIRLSFTVVKCEVSHTVLGGVLIVRCATAKRSDTLVYVLLHHELTPFTSLLLLILVVMLVLHHVPGNCTLTPLFMGNEVVLPAAEDDVHGETRVLEDAGNRGVAVGVINAVEVNPSLLEPIGVNNANEFCDKGVLTS